MCITGNHDSPTNVVNVYFKCAVSCSLLLPARLQDNLTNNEGPGAVMKREGVMWCRKHRQLGSGSTFLWQNGWSLSVRMEEGTYLLDLSSLYLLLSHDFIFHKIISVGVPQPPYFHQIQEERQCFFNWCLFLSLCLRQRQVWHWRK